MRFARLQLSLARLAVLHHLAFGRSKFRGAALIALLGALALAHGGPRHSLLHTALGTRSFVYKPRIVGFVAPGFEAVKAAFEANFAKGFERSAQICVYFKGQKVVDLAGSIADPEYDEDSLQLVFSCSKVVATLGIALAVQKGLIKYDAKVSEYWPEFAKHGKDQITVANVLRHESGLSYFPEKVFIGLAARHRLDEMADFIANQPLVWNFKKDLEEGARLYHGTTRGFILNELIRRTDPKGRTLGELVREEIAEPLGVTIVLGEPTETEKARMTKLKFEGFHHVVAKSVLNDLTGKSMPDDALRSREFFREDSHLKNWIDVFHHFDHHDADNWFNETEAHELEIPSANVLSNARSFGKVADLMSRGQLLDKETENAFHDKVVEKFDHGLLFKTCFSQGGVCSFSNSSWNEDCKDFWGWGGFGGSMFAWNRKDQIGFSYTMNGPLFGSIMGFRDPRCLFLLASTMKSVKKLTAARY